MKKTTRRFGSRRGNAFVELALCSTVLMLIFTGTLQFGYSFYQYNSLINAVRGGARYASMATISNQSNGILSNSYVSAVQNTVVYGSPNPSNNSTPIVPGLTTSDVDVTVIFDGLYVPKTVTVKIKTFTIDGIVKKFTMSDKPSLQIQFLGQYCPVSC